MNPYRQKLFLLSVLTMPLAACVSLDALQSPPSAEYGLSTPEIEAVSPASSTSHHLVVEMPAADLSLAGDQIVLHRAANRIERIADTRWAGPLPTLIQSALLDSLQRSHRFATVSPELRYAGRNLVLKITVRDMHAAYSDNAGPPTILVRLAYQVMEVSSRQVILISESRALQPAAANRVADIMIAFDRAFSKVTLDLFEQLQLALAES